MSELNFTTAQFDGYEVRSFRSETTGKPIKYQAVTEGGNETEIVKSAKQVHELGQKLAAAENAQPEPETFEIPEEIVEEARTEEPTTEVIEQIEEAVVVEEAKADSGENDPEATFEAQGTALYRGPAKHFWRSLGRQGGILVGAAMGVHVRPSNKDMSVKVMGDQGDVERTVGLLQEIWSTATKSMRAWCKEDETYQGHSRKTAEGRKARYDLEEDYLRTYAQGYAMALLERELGVSGTDENDDKLGYVDGYNDYLEAHAPGGEAEEEAKHGSLNEEEAEEAAEEQTTEED